MNFFRTQSRTSDQFNTIRTSIVSFFGQVWNHMQEHSALIVALSQAVLSVFFFIVIHYPDELTFISFFRQRWFALGGLVLALLVPYWAAFFNNKPWPWQRALSAFVHSAILIVASLLYYVRLNNLPIGVFGFDITTGIVFIPLTILIFVVNWEIFERDRQYGFLVISQVILLLALSYSVVSFLKVDYTAERSFFQNWLSSLFLMPQWIWIVMTGSIISWITVRNIHGINLYGQGVFFIAFAAIISQLMIVVNLLPVGYWYHALMVLITWDFCYRMFIPLMVRRTDAKFIPRLIVSGGYHALLFILVMVVGLLQM